MIHRTETALLQQIIEKDRKMAFLSGPRQVGKTTLTHIYRKRFDQTSYLNWDVRPDKKKILTDPYFFEKENRDPRKPFLVVLDEIHKYHDWKNYLKGAFDRYHEEFRFLITGSGRLELFKKGGDSLFGRYFSVPLFPLTMGELHGRLSSLNDFKKYLNHPPEPSQASWKRYENLFRFSGFPEPFSVAKASFYNRWFSERKDLLLREDIRDATGVRQLSLLENLAHLIPERVGSSLSLNTLRQDIGVAFETIRDWLLILEQFFYLFRVTPFTGNLARTLRKGSKAYLFDWAEIDNEGARFENLVASHLLKAVHFWTDRGLGDYGLWFVRDKEKRETDFLVTRNHVPWFLIEVKFSHKVSISKNLFYFQ